jgi:hypothetical protein
MTSTTKKTFITFCILTLIGVAAAFYLWNKPHQDVENAAAIKTDAVTLYKVFSTDSFTANKKYIQQVIEVSGTIKSISKNQQNQTVVLIKTDTNAAFINCTLEQNSNTLRAGQPINIKGICNGIGQGDADLGINGDVYLVRCYLVK